MELRIFFTGVLATLVATPCIAPLYGRALGCPDTACLYIPCHLFVFGTRAVATLPYSDFCAGNAAQASKTRFMDGTV